MAHTIQYWYDFMITEKNSQSSLNALQPIIDNSQTLLTDVKSTSRVARWRLWLWVIATCAFAVEVVVDLAVKTLEALAANSRYGTLPWYNDQSLKFQYGDALVLVNNQWQYAVIDETKQIIKRAASEENGNNINVKIAKLVAGVPTKLNTLEKVAYDAYLQKIKPPGTHPVGISDDPDEVRLYLKINYDPLLLDSTGQLISTPGTYPVADAVNIFISNLNVYNFNGTLELCDLVDAMQKATGVDSAYIISASGRYGTNPFVVFTERYLSNAGYLIIDALNPLSSTTTYQPIS